MTEAQQRQYIAEMMAKFDEGSRIATAINKVAKAMIADGLSAEAVAKYTGLSADEIAAL